ncbi:MAG TPA: polysaccharide deacetylase family protein [Solirubrobacteraceae bacterium]
MRSGVRVVLVGLMAAVIAAPLAHASFRAPAPAPLEVQTASLRQSGQDLVWSVELRAPFSPGALRAAGRSLCLVIAHVGDGAGSGQLCLIGPRPGGRTPQLQYRPAGGTGGAAGEPSTIAGRVSRASPRQLTAIFLPSAIGLAYTSVRWQVTSTLARSHCVTPQAAPCVTLWPATGALARLHTPRPSGCTATGPAFIPGITTPRREIALTFDDGPWYQTPQFLALLKRYRVAATFFEIGEHISQYGEGGAIERRMLADGDMIGDHTWSHINVTGAGPLAAGQIEETADAIRQATGGFTPCLFRAPDGNVSPALIAEARSLGFTTIQWDIDPRDWALPGSGEIEGNVLANAHPGAIVIMHDGGGDRSQTLAALPDIIDTLRRRGYTFVTITQLLGMQLIYR